MRRAHFADGCSHSSQFFKKLLTFAADFASALGVEHPPFFKLLSQLRALPRRAAKGKFCATFLFLLMTSLLATSCANYRFEKRLQACKKEVAKYYNNRELNKDEGTEYGHIIGALSAIKENSKTQFPWIAYSRIFDFPDKDFPDDERCGIRYVVVHYIDEEFRCKKIILESPKGRKVYEIGIEEAEYYKKAYKNKILFVVSLYLRDAAEKEMFKENVTVSVENEDGVRGVGALAHFTNP